MNPEIKKLLLLSSIPGFKMTAKEQARLEEWKKAQETLEIKPKKKTRSKPSKSSSKPSKKSDNIIIPEVEKVQNVITTEDLTLNGLES